MRLATPQAASIPGMAPAGVPDRSRGGNPGGMAVAGAIGFRPHVPPGAAPLVTVVMPIWNRAALVAQAAASVLAQTHRDWELVVVDDGSTDDTVARLRDIADPRLKIITEGRSGNISKLRNRGVACGSGAYLAFLDADDLWPERALELRVDALRRGTGRWCYGNHALLEEDGRIVPPKAGIFQRREGRILRPLVLGDTAAFIGTLLVERSLFEAVGGFDEGLPLRGDLDLVLRLASLADAACVPETLALVREHPGRTTHGVADPHERSALVFEKLLARERDPGVRQIACRRRARHLADAGAQHLAAGRHARAVVLAARALAGGAGPGYVARRMAGVLFRQRT